MFRDRADMDSNSGRQIMSQDMHVWLYSDLDDPSNSKLMFQHELDW